jgi:uncharacterized protein (TIGR02996 family)
MLSHPDADAFVRAILRDPADVTTRLVFADWLEETDDSSNVAWARFIRLKAEAACHRFGSPQWAKLEAQAAGDARLVRANLTLPAGVFVSSPKPFLQLLPAPSITVQLAKFEVPRAVIEFVPESVARENCVLPLDLQPDALLIASADPDNRDTTEKLGFILNEGIVSVRAELDAIVAAINRHYGQTETESIDCVLYESPLVGLEGDEVSGEIFGIFHTAFSQNCSGFEVERTESGSVLRYTPRQEPIPQEHRSAGVYSRLLDHFLSLPTEAEYTERGSRCLEFDIPLLSGRRFPATLERRPAERGRHWFRVRFRWDDRE